MSNSTFLPSARLATVVFVTGWLWWTATETTAASTQPKSKPASAQTILFFADTQPLLVRLHLAINGRPLDEVWEELFRGSYWKKVDQDGDGFVTKDEAGKGQPFDVFLKSGAAPRQTKRKMSRDFKAMDRDPADGKVSLSEAMRYYRRRAGPLQLRGVVRVSPARKLNRILLQLLDSDHDDGLSAQELARLPQVLLRRDQNEDELVTPTELDPRITPNLPVGPGGVMTDPRNPTKGLETRAIALSDRSRLRKWVAELQIRYGKKDKRLRNKRLTQEELGLTDADFRRLDRDNDGWLDAVELEGFFDRTPDLELAVDLANLFNGKIRPVSDPDRPARMNAGLRRLADGSLVLTRNRILIEFSAGLDRSSGMMSIAMMVPEEVRVKARFAALDRDNNGYLDKTEAKQIGLNTPSQFARVDRDKDGKLFPKEVVQILMNAGTVIQPIGLTHAICRISHKGNGFFDLIDNNRDGQLSIREMRRAVEIAKALDSDGDGRLQLNEIPQRFGIHVTAAQTTSTFTVRPVFVAVTNRQRPAPVRQERRPGPDWFHSMDRNGDGDVSPREFLGTAEQFKRIDLDGDGLIDANEAAQADVRFRKKPDRDRSGTRKKR